jgi:hypothetical protein
MKPGNSKVNTWVAGGKIYGIMCVKTKSRSKEAIQQIREGILPKYQFPSYP